MVSAMTRWQCKTSILSSAGRFGDLWNASHCVRARGAFGGLALQGSEIYLGIVATDGFERLTVSLFGRTQC